MKKKLPVLFALCMFAAAGAQALSTDDLIAVSAMPVAVAEVVALPEVPRDDFVTVVTTLNEARVPAPQFIEVVRYAPVALVDAREPRFVTYVTREYDRGLVGEPLAVSIANRYETYGIDDVDVVDPPVVTYVERREYLPPVVVSRFQPVTFDPVSLVAMPLAVAAVADLVDVPATDLMQFVSALNLARVPAPQFVEVVRYSPVVLVDRTESPRFVRYVRTEVDRGVYGRPLAYAVADRLRTVDDDIHIDVVEPRPILVADRDEILPPIVEREVRAHPHGGPPGLLKKELGLQTGAEVVHGSLPRRSAPTRVTRSVVEREPRVTRERATPRQHAVTRHAPKQKAVKRHEPKRQTVTRHAPKRHEVKQHARPHADRRIDRPRPQERRVERARPQQRHMKAPRVERQMTHAGGQQRGGGGKGKRKG